MAHLEKTTELVPFTPGGLNKSSQQLAIRGAEAGAADYVPHLSIDQVRSIANAATGRHAERDRLLIMLLFDGCLRCSEALGTRPRDLERAGAGWLVKIVGKGSKPGVAAISATLAAELQAYAYRQGIPPDARLFPITRPRAFQIVTEAFDKAGIPRPSRTRDKVGSVHILRHSGAIERLRQTRNPKALQDQLRHKSARMTLRYLKTLSSDESLEIQQEVDFNW